MPPALSRHLRVDLVDVPRESPTVTHRLLVLFEIIQIRGHRAVPTEDAFPAVTFARPPTVPILPVLARVLLEAEPPSSTVTVSDQFTGGEVFHVHTLTEFCCRDPGAFPLAERLGVRQPAPSHLKQLARMERHSARTHAANTPRIVRNGFEPAIGTESPPERFVRCGVAPFAANFPRTTQIYSGQVSKHLAEEITVQRRLGLLHALPFTSARILRRSRFDRLGRFGHCGLNTRAMRRCDPRENFHAITFTDSVRFFRGNFSFGKSHSSERIRHNPAARPVESTRPSP